MRSVIPKGEWEWKCIGANRESKKGRVKGGIILRIKKGVRIIKEGNMEKEWVVENKLNIDGEKWRIVGIYNRGG